MKQWRTEKAFSLVELLVVVAVIGALSALVAPAVTQLLTARNLDRATVDLAGVLDEARARAVSRSGYVFVGLDNRTVGGSGALAFAAMEAEDGSPSIVSGSMRELVPQRLFSGVRMVDAGTLGSGVEDRLQRAEEDQMASVDLASESTLILQDRSGTTFNRVLIFSPQGEVIVSSILPTGRTPYADAVVIGLRTVRGTEVSTDDNAAALRIQGGNGSYQIFRP